MKVSEVDIHIINKLLMSVPQSLEIESIDLSHGYNLKLSASVDILNRIETEISLQELREVIKSYDSKERKKLQ